MPLRLYLDTPTLSQVRAGQHNFFNRLRGAVEGQGWRVELRENTLAELAKAPLRRGHALFHMSVPHPGALTCRRSYLGAFWRIEACAERWRWPVALAAFDAAAVDPELARRFAGRLRQSLHPAGLPQRDPAGMIFVPLQGRLSEHRSFQSMSPLAMLETLLQRFSPRPVLATLHPRESYLEAELQALDRLAAAHPNFRWQNGGSAAALADCALVATQNSAMAIQGYLLHKPALLFAEIDFHHIAASVPREGMAALDRALTQRPDFDAYLWWFLQEQAINAGRPECEAQILAALRRGGWAI
ncbi:hypothetical protein [Phaeovulum sp. W22_SRMD_FR3]|uniref:hypothetical protein n=1 Tax=Phaeovulum sp. W22_SRMD_FR3 TaxID=3240274 RepID=UPI003F97E0A3